MAEWSPIPLASGHLVDPAAPAGVTLLQCTSVMQVWLPPVYCYVASCRLPFVFIFHPVLLQVVTSIFSPITKAQEAYLLQRGDGAAILAPGVALRYCLFRVGLALLRPRRVDDVWDPSTLHHNPFLGRVLGRKAFYLVQRLATVDVPLLAELCSRHWSECWQMGPVGAGDEQIVPHKGKRAGPIRQFVPRKPHNTGVKLYALCDSGSAYCVDVYVYFGRLVGRTESDWSGSAAPAEVVLRWHSLLPEGVILVCDSFFGSHRTAADLAAADRPFVLLMPRSAAMVKEASLGLGEGELHSATNTRDRYTLSVFKNPRVGAKAARVVPFTTNCTFPEPLVPHKDFELHALVHFYRTQANGVDHVNQYALSHRELGRMSKWSNAVRSFMIRLAVTNSFTTCKQLGLIESHVTCFDFSYGVLKAACPVPLTIAVTPLHLPETIPLGRRRTCVVCGFYSRYFCTGCTLVLHPACWVQGHIPV
jgi:hypothetical protein